MRRIDWLPWRYYPFIRGPSSTDRVMHVRRFITRLIPLSFTRSNLSVIISTSLLIRWSSLSLFSLFSLILLYSLILSYSYSSVILCYYLLFFSSLFSLQGQKYITRPHLLHTRWPLSSINPNSIERVTNKRWPHAVDLEVHVGSDGRFYMIDFSRMFPPETPRVE